jgi:hypothetical protein
MKSATRPQYHRLRRILEMIRQGTGTGSPPNCGHFMRELEVSRRTVMRDLDFLRDDHNAPIQTPGPGAGKNAPGIGSLTASRCPSSEFGGAHPLPIAWAFSRIIGRGWI